MSPPLNWFRGLDLDATMTEKTVSAHAEVIMQIADEEVIERRKKEGTEEIAGEDVTSSMFLGGNLLRPPSPAGSPRVVSRHDV